MGEDHRPIRKILRHDDFKKKAVLVQIDIDDGIPVKKAEGDFVPSS
jgi:hypothetical protein